MPNAADAGGILRQNLIDAGCGPETVRQCIELAQRQENAALLRILSCHRQALLDTLHQSEKQIDSLDYLVYAIEKQQKMNGGS